MKKKSALPGRFTAFATFAALTASLAWADTSRAVVYTETASDGGDLPGTAQIIAGDVGTAYTAIQGATTNTNGLYDSDMFGFTVPTAESLTFSTNFFVPGRNNFDTQLAVFDSAGVGLFANDDASGGSSQSTLTLTLSPGDYFLLLSGSGRYATDSTAGLIFPNFTDGTTDPAATVPATSTSPITGYTGNTDEGGAYTISIAITPVPEPGACTLLLTGLAGAGLILRSRRRHGKELRPVQA